MLHTPSSLNPVNLVNPVQNSFAERKAANWNVRGAWKDSFWLPFEDDWVFPHGTNHLSGVEVVSYGEVWATPFGDAVASLGVPVEIVPGLSAFGYEHTPSNSYRFVWADAAINRNTNTLVTASIELSRDGDVSVTTNGVVAHLPRELPFPHNGFGQDDEWVAANFTNATEILAVGYPQWVDAQVGTGLTNGLYKLTVAVDCDPLETTQISVGELSIAVTNAGEYVFLLEKGPDYDFAVFPPSSNVTISAVDDIAATRGAALRGGFVETALPARAGGDGTWMPDGGEFRTDYVVGMGYARFWWLPWLCGSPDVTHIGPNDEVTFSAVMGDYCRADDVSFRWTASDGLSLSTPNAQSTAVAVDSMPSWASAYASVTATFGDRSLTSYLDLSYGTNSIPQVHLSLNITDTILVSTNQYSDCAPGMLRLIFSADCETNAVIRLLCRSGESKFAIRDAATGYPVTLPLIWYVGDALSKDFVVEGVSASDATGDIVFAASLQDEGGGNGMNVEASTTIADLWHLTVSEEPTDRGRCVLGVGESVLFCYLPKDIYLSAIAPIGEFVTPVDGMLMYRSPHEPVTECVSICIGSATCSEQFTTTAPTGFIVESVDRTVYEAAGYSGLFKLQFNNRIAPTNVSFYAIEVLEVPMVSQDAVGYFTQPDMSDCLDHGKRGAGEWSNVGFGNQSDDIVAVGYYPAPWLGGGSYTWPIPVAWRCRDDFAVTNVFCHTDQRFELDADGTARVFKFGYCGERTTNNTFNLSIVMP